MERTSLPPGFRFHPTDVELIKYYLKRKVMGKRLQFNAISELNIYKFSPWDLPDKSSLRSKDLEWYFFCPNERKYASQARTNRATESGYWKSTGKDRPVFYDDQTVGTVKTLVFHNGRAPKGERTDWVMYEYRIQDQKLADAGVVQDAYVLCKVFQKSGPGPKTNAQYGAPFSEEEWDDDDAKIFGQSLPSNSLLPPAVPYNTNNSVGTSMFIPGSMCFGPLSEPGPSNVLPSAGGVPPLFPGVPPLFPDNEDFICLSDILKDNSSLLSDHTDNNEVVESFIHENSEGLTLYGDEINYGLGDLDNWPELSGGGFSFSSNQTAEYDLIPFPAGDNNFLELNDLNYPLNGPAESNGSGDFTDSFYELAYNYLGQDDFLVDFFDNAQLPLLPDGFNWNADHFGLFQENSGVTESADMGVTARSCNDNFTPCEQPEEGTSHAEQNESRGQRKSNSRFNKASFYSTYGGSSIHVKAEVTRSGGGCTEDALSENLGESPYEICGCKLTMTGFGKKVGKWGNWFGVLFFARIISTLFWVFLVAVFTNLADTLGILSFLEYFVGSILCYENCRVHLCELFKLKITQKYSFIDLVFYSISF